VRTGKKMRRRQASPRLSRVVHRFVMGHLFSANSITAGQAQKAGWKRRYFHFSAPGVNSGRVLSYRIIDADFSS
jgi:hypothetical protein